MRQIRNKKRKLIFSLILVSITLLTLVISSLYFHEYTVRKNNEANNYSERVLDPTIQNLKDL